MAKSKKAIIAVVVIAVMAVLVVFGIRAQSKGSDDGLPKNAPTVQVTEVRQETIVTEVTANGVVEFVDQEIIYPSTTAKIDSIFVEVGDEVKKGQVLVKYDPKTLENLEDQLKDAELILKTAKLGLESASLPANESESLQAETGVKNAEKSISDVENQIEQNAITLEQSKRGLDDAKKKLETAKEDFNNSKILYDNGVISKSDLDKLEDAVTATEEAVRQAEELVTTTENTRRSLVGALETAETSLASAKAQHSDVVNRANDPKVRVNKDAQQVQIEQAQRSIEKIEKEIRDFIPEEVAGSDGTVLSVGYEEGEMASAAKPICTIADTTNDNLVITVYIPEKDATKIELGQDATIRDGALGDDKYSGKVTKIYPTAETIQTGNSAETAIKVEVFVDDKEAKIKSGFTVETDIITAVVENATVVPIMATMESAEGNTFVYVVNAENEIVRKNVELGLYSDLNVQVEGVEVGDLVVSEPSSSIMEGQVVRTINTNMAYGTPSTEESDSPENNEEADDTADSDGSDESSDNKENGQ